MGISEEQLEAMRAEARADRAASAGDFIILDEPGEFFAGTVVRYEEAETSFGTVEEMIVEDVRTSTGPRDGECRFRLSRTVPRKELGSESDNGQVPAGSSVYVEYLGESTSKSGRSFHRYACKRFESVPEGKKADKSAVDAAKEKIKEAFDSEEIPF